MNTYNLYVRGTGGEFIPIPALKGSPGDKGDKGDPGTGLDPKGIAPSTSAIPDTAQQGDVWLVGSSAPYTVYMLNNGQWVSLGQLQGVKGEDGATFVPSVTAKGVLSFSNDKGLPNPAAVNIKGTPGDPGAAATVSVGTVSTLPYGQDAVVTNTGTASAAVLNFAIPQGKTPVKGTDYWTESDRQSIGASITPQMIGAVPEPESKQNGDVLKWNGSAWIAGDANESGVQSVNGKSGAVKTRLIFQNQTIAASAFTRQSSPTYADFPYVASKALSGVTADMIPEVIFSVPDATGGNFAPVAETYSGGVYLYARTAPTGNTSIPVILMTV